MLDMRINVTLENNIVRPYTFLYGQTIQAVLYSAALNNLAIKW